MSVRPSIFYTNRHFSGVTTPFYRCKDRFTDRRVEQGVNTHRIFKRLAKALISLHVCAAWSEPLLCAYTTYLEISYHGSIIIGNQMRLGIIISDTLTSAYRLGFQHHPRGPADYNA